MKHVDDMDALKRLFYFTHWLMIMSGLFGMSIGFAFAVYLNGI